MSRAQNFAWETPEFIQFEDKDVVKFEIIGAEEFEETEDIFGVKIRARVVDASAGKEHIGKEIPMTFNFLTKNGKQNVGTFHFLNAMFPKEMKAGQPLPFHFLEGSFFSAVSKRVPAFKDPTVKYQNWQNYKSLGRPDEGNNF